MAKLVQRYGVNPTGRDLIVGDIHGFFSKLEGELAAIDFDPTKGDRLFSVGDLVDRGPESAKALEWLTRPWFHPVQGNHEDMAISWALGGLDASLYRMNGGGWNLETTKAVRKSISAAFAELPVAIELQTEGGLLGIVHADCPARSWVDFVDVLERPIVTDRDSMNLSHAVSMAQWSRDRCDKGSADGVAGVRAVVVGHTPMRNFTSLGNVLYIDTGGWLGRPFTILDAATLRPATRSRLMWTGAEAKAGA